MCSTPFTPVDLCILQGLIISELVVGTNVGLGLG